MTTKKGYFLSDEEFNKFLEGIGGLENGYRTDRPPIKERYICGCGNGWLGLIKDLIESCIDKGWDKQICQIKEKFGGLRFYINSAPREVHDLISEAENKSYTICEECGNDGSLRNDKRWWKTLCDSCENDETGTK